MTRADWLWRFDWNPDFRELVLAEAEALGAGAPIAPGLFLGTRPYEAGLAGFGVGGGQVLSDAPTPAGLVVPADAPRIRVAKGPWKVSGNPADLLARLGRIAPAPPGWSPELYVTPDRWVLVRATPSPHYVAPELPYRNSSSLSSQVARAVVNLVARPGDRLLDPVCGTGVLLVEAARLGCSVVGWDINRKAAGSARANLRSLGLSGEVLEQDALQVPPADDGFDVLVGDLPYGIRLTGQALEPFLRTLPPRAKRWALVAHEDPSDALAAAGAPPRFTIRIVKPTFTRYLAVGP